MTKEVLRMVFDVDATLVNLPNSNVPVCLSYELLRDHG